MKRTDAEALITEIEKMKCPLTKWEQKFIESIKGGMHYGYCLTKKQGDVLQKIYREKSEKAVDSEMRTKNIWWSKNADSDGHRDNRTEPILR